MKVFGLFAAILLLTLLIGKAVDVVFSVFSFGTAVAIIVAAACTIWITVSNWSNGFTGISPKKTYSPK